MPGAWNCVLPKCKLFEKANVYDVETSVIDGMIWLLVFGPFGEADTRR